MTKSEIRNITEEIMLLQKKQLICICNSQGKQDFACSQWYLDIENSTTASQAGGVTLADVKYFISICSPRDVKSILKTAICSQKQNFDSLANIIKTFWNFNATQGQIAYDSCPLTQVQKDDMCTMKRNLFTVEEIQEICMNYPDENVSAVFDSCQSFANLDDKPADKIVMCNFQNTPGFEYRNPASAILWDTYFELYGTEQTEAQI